ncbi:MAG TPA: sigma 54-interacting transcriptional regulator [Firmicutes bacterium]|nr:sigma 54-interacting transcriptional regulator [Bacillota bacterium]
MGINSFLFRLLFLKIYLASTSLPVPDSPFIPINCAGVPEELIESELFGYLPGAFTGARKEGKMGVFELADRGTLFLDEVSEIPLSKQAKLLRVLENGELMKIGATSSKRIDVRIIAATNRDLESMIQNKTFREDLFYRLNVIPLVLPPLRDRPEDILLLAKYFLRKYNDKYQTHKEFSKSCETKFVRYKWPGNVRELKNIIHRMVITSEGDVIEPVELGVSCSLSPIALKAPSEFAGSDLKTAIQNYEIRCINQAITASEGNITRAAQKLGVHRTYIYRKMKKQSCEH